MSGRTRRLARRRQRQRPSWRVWAAVAVGMAYIAGVIGSAALPPWINGGVGLVVVALLVVAFVSSSDDEHRPLLDAGSGMLVVCTGFGVVRYLEHVGMEAYPLVYLILTGVVAFQPRRSGLWTTVYAVAVGAGAHLLRTAPGVGDPQIGLAWVEPVDWWMLGPRAVLLAGFGSFAYLVGGSRVGTAEGERGDPERQRENLLERAREFRLLNAGRAGPEHSERSDVEEFAVMDAVEAVEREIFETLSLLKVGLDCHTCVLLWFDVGRDQLEIKELVSDSDNLVERPLDPAQGVLGSIARRRESVRLEELRAGFRGLSYYRADESVEHFFGIPLLEDGHLRGILCLDRLDDPSFSDAECRVVEMVGDSILRTIENERIFKNVEATKFELGQFFNASRRLNSVLSMEQVLEAALESAADVFSYDFAALTLCESNTTTHRVAAVDTDPRLEVDADRWRDRTFEVNSGLVSMVVKNEHYLPYGGKVRDGETVVFTREEELDELQSLLVLPLIARDEAIGTLVVGSRSGGGVSAERREMLEVIANQVAVSLQNARLYARMEKLATTDELTGLPNRRTFDRKLDEAIARHGRAERSFGLIFLDIDHFKQVNDTYGHPVGDEVLEDVSEVIRESVRGIDVPTRYGGEEFAVILEETGCEGARQVAERIRQGVADLEFEAVGESFTCTVSLGIAVWPDDARAGEAIVDAADEALYASKENGRDRVTIWRELE